METQQLELGLDLTSFASFAPCLAPVCQIPDPSRVLVRWWGPTSSGATAVEHQPIAFSNSLLAYGTSLHAPSRYLPDPQTYISSANRAMNLHVHRAMEWNHLACNIA